MLDTDEVDAVKFQFQCVLGGRGRLPGVPVPGGPAGPGGPCIPGTPCAPCTPGAPGGPTAPAGPTGPIGPAGPPLPSGPVAPAPPHGTRVKPSDVSFPPVTRQVTAAAGDTHRSVWPAAKPAASSINRIALRTGLGVPNPLQLRSRELDRGALLLRGVDKVARIAGLRYCWRGELQNGNRSHRRL